jgi:hypothetical protein
MTIVPVFLAIAYLAGMQMRILGILALALVLALLVAAMGSQTFYPREGSVGMWAAIGVMLRVSVEKRKALEGGLSFEDGQVATQETATAKEASGAYCTCPKNRLLSQVDSKSAK